MSYKLSFSVMFLHPNPVCTSLLPHTLNTTQSPVTSPSYAQTSSSAPHSETTSASVFSSMRETKFHTHAKQQAKFPSSSSIGTATLVGFGLLNYRWVFSAGRFLQSAVANGTSNPQIGGPVIRTFRLPPPGVPHAWNDASEPQQRKVELWERNCREFCRKWRLPRHFWVLLHAVNLRHGTDGFTYPLKKGMLRIF